jgi:hypothetical protein
MQKGKAKRGEKEKSERPNKTKQSQKENRDTYEFALVALC